MGDISQKCIYIYYLEERARVQSIVGLIQEHELPHLRGGRTEFIRLLIDVLVNCIFCT